MPTKPLPLIALVLLVPVAILAFLAVRTLSLENEALKVQRERFANQRIDAAENLVITSLQNLGTAVLVQAQAAYAAGGIGSLSAMARKRAFMYAFVFKDGAPIDAAIAVEHQYDRARSLQNKSSELAGSMSELKRSAVSLVPDGWSYTLLSCSRSGSGNDLCIAVDNASVMHELRSALAVVAQTAGLTRVGLADPRGTVIGLDEAGAEVSSASHPLHGGMEGWQLRVEEYFSDDVSLMQNPLFLYLVAGALIAGWLAMTWMLHRSTVLKEEAGSARANVIAQLAHELRTPLANLKLHTDLLRRKASDVTAIERYSEILDSEIDRLSHLAENAITVARGAIARPKLETAVPDDCLNSILERFEPILSEARCCVGVAAGAGKSAMFDRTSWERCVVNLIDNARKYAPGSDIAISTKQSAGMLRLEVADHGPGIADNRREQIFEPLERSITSKVSGFGLGLAAVRTLARQNEGDCWVESMNPGARFVLTMRALPCGAPELELAKT